jgi:hypothetical protein
LTLRKSPVTIEPAAPSHLISQPDAIRFEDWSEERPISADYQAFRSEVMDGEQRDDDVSSREYALSLDAQDSVSHIREQFLIPSKAQLKADSLQEGTSTLSSPLLAEPS